MTDDFSRIEYRARNLVPERRYVLGAEEALGLIRRAATLGVEVRSIFGVRSGAGERSRLPDHAIEFPRVKSSGDDSWALAATFVEQRRHLDLIFEITLI